MFFHYAEGGSYAEETLRANRADFEHIKLRQRVLCDVSRRERATTMIGEAVDAVVALAAREAKALAHPPPHREGYGERQLPLALYRGAVRPGVQLQGRRLYQDHLPRQSHPQSLFFF